MGKLAEAFPNSSAWEQVSSVSPRKKYPWTERSLKTVGLLALALGTLHVLLVVQTSRHGLLQKFSPTTYTRLKPQDKVILEDTRWMWNDQSTAVSESTNNNNNNYSRHDLWAKKSEWRKLGSGVEEGETFFYNDMVIKVFGPNLSPFRNCLPSAVGKGQRWPAEISTSLLLGGLGNAHSTTNETDFIPVVDYFTSPEDGDEPIVWYLVTPFLPSGSLNQLAKKLRQADDVGVLSARHIDLMFRPSLERLLDSLHRLHKQYDLCHDNIRPDNIFIMDEETKSNAAGLKDGFKTQHWILANMGNARETSHPYHSSTLWASTSSSNLADCRVSDTLRLLKSYLLFLRSSVHDQRAFDVQFLGKSEPWSQLYWNTWDEIRAKVPVSAATVRIRSDTLNKATDEPHPPPLATRDSENVAAAIDRLLVGAEYIAPRTAREVLAVDTPGLVSRMTGLLSVFGVPVVECKA